MSIFCILQLTTKSILKEWLKFRTEFHLEILFSLISGKFQVFFLKGIFKLQNHWYDICADRTIFTCFKQISTTNRSRRVDKITSVVFPTSFLLFNIIYWIYYFVHDMELKRSSLDIIT